MSNAFFTVPKPTNEPIFDYEPNSPERAKLEKQIAEMRSSKVDIPMYIGSETVFTDTKKDIHPPHELSLTIGSYSYGDAQHVEQAIEAALAAREAWADMPWQHRVAIFLKAADLLAGPYRYKINAATMIGQSKNVYQAEIDAVCELIDFLRFNAHYLTEIYQRQPMENSPGVWNRLTYRPLEGFIFALTPFNFTAIAGNLCAAPAICGNTIVWKPAETQIYSAQVLMEVFKEAGLPDGVINLIYVDGPTAGEVVFKHPKFAGLHFTGSTKVFQHLWKTIGENISKYHSYPRIVGETGGKDFVVGHKSADPVQVATALSRGAFEFQGQKCSAASRAYISESIWPAVKEELLSQVKSFKMGPTHDFKNFINAVIDERAFDKISGYIDDAKAKGAEVLIGGNYDKSEGYFIEPTVLKTDDPKFRTMVEEIFGPVLTVYVYKDKEYEEMLKLVDTSSPYALTGAFFAKDRDVIVHAEKALENSAGNFYINDKPTGAVVGQQPFGGGRASGTNDKAGDIFNLYRWMNFRTIKENFVAPKQYGYPFLG